MKDWPEAESLPDFMEFSEVTPPELHTVFPEMCEQGLDLISKLLSLNPKKRPTAEEALQHAYFKSGDMCQPGELPINSFLSG